MGMTKKVAIDFSRSVDKYECGECAAHFVTHCGDEPIYCPFCGKQLDLES